MTSLAALWLPIVLSAVFVFLLSSVIHMGPFWHRSDYPRVPNEDKVRDALRPLAIPPGDYMVPRPTSGAEMSSPEFLDKVKQGPVLMLTVMPNMMVPMGRNLALWFVYALVVSAVAACAAGITLAPGTDEHDIFHVTALVTFMGYAAALWQMSIWYRRSWSLTIKATVDGALYALLTAGTFVWLWP
ncbi:MAG: hypothetical protein HOP28_16740 [Gemmatimonadales bacterium]|nr:hypothetical protein [Gemmatimonadales bacterium]